MRVDDPADAASVIPPRILVIEDDYAFGEALIKMLQISCMQTQWARTGAEAMAMYKTFSPEIVLTDLGLPDADGISLVSYFARRGDCGVIVISGRVEDTDRIVGLELGADDYVTKPTHLRELLARIRALHRRMKNRSEVELGVATRRALQIGPLFVDLDSRSVTTSNGTRVAFTGAEFAALEAMVEANGVAVSREKLCQIALHRPLRVDDRGVDQLIFSIRHKLQTNRVTGNVIHSIRGEGYLLSVNSAALSGATNH